MKMLFPLLLIAAFVVAAGAEPPALTAKGLGAVHIGMRQAEAERALGAKLDIGYPEDESCGQGGRADGVDPGVSYMFDDGRLARIDVWNRNGNVNLIEAAGGIHVGSSEADVRRVFGRRVVAAPDPYVENEGRYLKVDAPGHKSGLLFETFHGAVTSFRAGTYPALGYSEGCV